jgi:hypothetical protein
VRERWPLLVLALAVASVGLVVMFKPFDTTITIQEPQGGALHATSHCGIPLRAAFSSSPDIRGWFTYARGTAVIPSDGVGCQYPAQRRTAFGGVAVFLGAALAVINLRRRSAKPVEAAVP